MSWKSYTLRVCVCGFIFTLLLYAKIIYKLFYYAPKNSRNVVYLQPKSQFKVIFYDKIFYLCYGKCCVR